ALRHPDRRQPLLEVGLDGEPAWLGGHALLELAHGSAHLFERLLARLPQKLPTDAVELDLSPPAAAEGSDRTLPVGTATRTHGATLCRRARRGPGTGSLPRPATYSSRAAGRIFRRRPSRTQGTGPVGRRSWYM